MQLRFWADQIDQVVLIVCYILKVNDASAQMHKLCCNLVSSLSNTAVSLLTWMTVSTLNLWLRLICWVTEIGTKTALVFAEHFLYFFHSSIQRQKPVLSLISGLCVISFRLLTHCNLRNCFVCAGFHHLWQLLSQDHMLERIQCQHMQSIATLCSLLVAGTVLQQGNTFSNLS